MKNILLPLLLCFVLPVTSHGFDVVRSAGSGRWTDKTTWEHETFPSAGDVVLVREDHSVIYDANSDEIFRAVIVSGTLEFARDRDTSLNCGLLKIQAGEIVTEEGFDCEANLDHHAHGESQASLLVGSSSNPIPRHVTAKIRLHHVDGMDPKSCPALVCCGGRMELHGAPQKRTWVKLLRTANPGDQRVYVKNAVNDWQPGDRLIVTGTIRQDDHKDNVTHSVADAPQTEEVRLRRHITKAGQQGVELAEPLQNVHFAEGEFRAEIANLSRNVIVESADPNGVRGHTMYHYGSRGSISYAEFRHLGKEGVLGRYSMHFHLVGDSMRGASVIGASIWDSHNRWITIHGTNYLVVRDCVGFKSIGHGFFLEDGTEVLNVLDRNLGVMALQGKTLKGQVLPFDHNEGAAFWWANSYNTFTRNVAVECDTYGFRFEATDENGFNPHLQVKLADGSHEKRDIRIIPFVRFEDNEAHTQRRFGMNLRGMRNPTGLKSFSSVVREAHIGPDRHHPFEIKGMKIWDTLWPYHAGTPGVSIEDMTIHRSTYGVWRSVLDRHSFANLNFSEITNHDLHQPISVPQIDSSNEDYYRFNASPDDEQPPFTVVTSARPLESGGWEIFGTSSDDGSVAKVLVNGVPTEQVDHFGSWRTRIRAEMLVHGAISARAVDDAGNLEPSPHQVILAPAEQVSTTGNPIPHPNHHD